MPQRFQVTTRRRRGANMAGGVDLLNSVGSGTAVCQTFQVIAEPNMSTEPRRVLPRRLNQRFMGVGASLKTLSSSRRSEMATLFCGGEHAVELAFGFAFGFFIEFETDGAADAGVLKIPWRTGRTPRSSWVEEAWGRLNGEMGGRKKAQEEQKG